MKETRRITVAGKVQGVGFRYVTKDLARSFEVVGSVKNLDDGDVEIILSAEAEEIDAFLRELTEESPVAHHILGIESEKIAALPGLVAFTIVR